MLHLTFHLQTFYFQNGIAMGIHRLELNGSRQTRQQEILRREGFRQEGSRQHQTLHQTKKS